MVMAVLDICDLLISNCNCGVPSFPSRWVSAMTLMLSYMTTMLNLASTLQAGPGGCSR